MAFGRNGRPHRSISSRKSASDYGFELREATFPHPISITTADNKRCTQTGLRIARQIQVGSRGVSHADFLGSGSPYFAKTQDRLALAGEGNYRQALNDYFKTGRQRGFNPLNVLLSIIRNLSSDIVRIERNPYPLSQLRREMDSRLEMMFASAGTTQVEQYNALKSNTIPYRIC